MSAKAGPTWLRSKSIAVSPATEEQPQSEVIWATFLEDSPCLLHRLTAGPGRHVRPHLAPAAKVSRGLTAATPMGNPYCSCKLTRVRPPRDNAGGEDDWDVEL